jgi:hypothetical protein
VSSGDEQVKGVNKTRETAIKVKITGPAPLVPDKGTDPNLGLSL